MPKLDNKHRYSDDYKSLFIKIIIIIIVSACPKYFDDYEYDDYGDYDEGITLPSTTKLCSCFDCSSAALNISFASSNSLMIIIMMLMLIMMRWQLFVLLAVHVAIICVT